MSPKAVKKIASTLSRQSGQTMNSSSNESDQKSENNISATLSRKSKPSIQISATASRKSSRSAKSSEAQISSTLSRIFEPTILSQIASHFPMPWSNYVRLLSVKNADARAFYLAEALRGGWKVRQLDRQISTLFYERTALSKNKAAMLKKGS